MTFPIYLDNNATTPVDPRVLEAMLPYFAENFGNPASVSHLPGDRAAEAVESSREQLAEVLGGRANEIVFTSGATESINLAIKGVARANAEKGKHIITCLTEHMAVLDTCAYLEQNGFEITYLPVDGHGLIDLDHLEDSIRADTILVSIMAANNETGVLQPIDEVGEICRSKHVPFHTDATQAVGKIPIDVDRMQIDLLSCSAHKIYGPKGVGALFIRKFGPRVRCEPIIHGGGHEGGFRSGTLNVPGIVGLAKAAQLAADELPREAVRLTSLRDRLVGGLQAELDEVHLNGHPAKRLPNTANLCFAWVEGESLLQGLTSLAVSTGSACSGANDKTSHVLKAMSIPDLLAKTAIRFSLGRFNTAEELEYTIGAVAEQVRRLRAISPIDELRTMMMQNTNQRGIIHT
jgi:cysteine desulfurase